MDMPDVNMFTKTGQQDLIRWMLEQQGFTEVTFGYHAGYQKQWDSHDQEYARRKGAWVEYHDGAETVRLYSDTYKKLMWYIEAWLYR